MTIGALIDSWASYNNVLKIISIMYIIVDFKYELAGGAYGRLLENI